MLVDTEKKNSFHLKKLSIVYVTTAEKRPEIEHWKLQVPKRRKQTLIE